MNDFTPEQNNQLKSWADERDSILSEIATKKEKSNTLSTQNENLAQSNTDLADRINLSLGRLSELEVKEKEMVSKVSTEISDLTTQKGSLQSEVAGLLNLVESLKYQKDLLSEAISDATDIYDRVFERASVLDEVVDHVTRISDDNARKVEILLSSLEGSVQKVLDINALNVEKTTYVIEELPKVFFSMQRGAPIKQTM